MAPRRGGPAPAAAPGHQRAPADRARRPPAAGRAHVHPEPRHARRRGPAPRRQRRAPREARPPHGASLRRLPRRGGEHRRAGPAPGLHAQEPRLSFPGLPAAAGPDAAGPPPPPERAGRAPALRHGPARREGAPADRTRAGPDRPPRPAGLLPDRVGPGRVLPRAGHPGAGPGLGGQQRGVLRAGHHRRGSRRDGAPVRAFPLRGAGRVAGHRPGPAERRPSRARDPVRLRALRPARRGHDRQRHHVSRPERGTRGGQGAGAARGPPRPPLAPRQRVRVQGPGRHAPGPPGRGRLRPARSAHAAVRRAVAGHPGPAAAPRPALGRHGHRAGAARLGGAARARDHARPLGGAVGQGRLRRARHGEGGPARDSA